jgi:hypothetical protein
MVHYLLSSFSAHCRRPFFNWMGEMPFPGIQAVFDPFFPKGLQWYWKGDFVKSLPDEGIDMHIAEAAIVPSDLSLIADRGHRPGSQQSGGVEELGRRSSIQSRRRLRQLHDG